MFDSKPRVLSVREENELLKKMLKDAIEIIDFDYENCDFGPVYGLACKRREEFLCASRKFLKRFLGN